MDLRKGLRLMSHSERLCDVVTLIEPCDGGWDVRVVWWLSRNGEWVREYTYPRVMRTDAELATYEVARYADPNRMV